MPEDEKLSCKQLKEEFAETRRFKQEAKAVKEANTGANMTRVILFWPALLKTMHNADVAIRAANDRAYHLIRLFLSYSSSGIMTSITVGFAQELNKIKPKLRTKIPRNFFTY